MKPPKKPKTTGKRINNSQMSKRTSGTVEDISKRVDIKLRKLKRRINKF